MGRSREICPDGVDGLPLLEREGIQSLGGSYHDYARISDVAITNLLELEIRPFVGHPLVPWTEFTLLRGWDLAYVLWRI